MNRDIFGGMWKQIKGHVKETWGELTDDEIEQIEGKRDQLAGRLQEKYGYTRMEAENEIDNFLRQVEADLKRQS